MGCLASKPVVAEPSFPAEDVTSKIEIALPTLLGKYAKPLEDILRSPMQQHFSPKCIEDLWFESPKKMAVDELQHKEIRMQCSSDTSEDHGTAPVQPIKETVNGTSQDRCRDNSASPRGSRTEISTIPPKSMYSCSLDRLFPERLDMRPPTHDADGCNAKVMFQNDLQILLDILES